MLINTIKGILVLVLIFLLTNQKVRETKVSDTLITPGHVIRITLDFSVGGIGSYLRVSSDLIAEYRFRFYRLRIAVKGISDYAHI